MIIYATPPPSNHSVLTIFYLSKIPRNDSVTVYLTKGLTMSIVKVIEIISEGKTIDEALKAAVQEASLTIRDIKQIDIEHIGAKVDKNQITKIRINAKISFVVHHENLANGK